MKKISMIAAFYFLFSTNLLAATFYDQLQDMFLSGSMPAKEELLGVNIGRCFDANQPNAAQPFLMYSAMDYGAGPIGSLQMANIYRFPGSNYAYFDTWKASMLPTPVRTLEESTDATALIAIEYLETFDEDYVWEVRKSTDSFVAHSDGLYCYTYMKGEQ